MIVVVDASVAAKWFIPEPGSEAAAALLATPHEFVAPRLLQLELHSVFLKKLRRGMIDSDLAQQALRELELAIVAFRPTEELLDDAWRIAVRFGGSIYDAIYMALARELDAYLVSADESLIRVAQAADVRCGVLADGLPSA